jgi:5-methylcytosine-specific restriction endonuclease McrA
LSDDYHRDHVIPVSKGGTNDIRNIVLACAPCNVRKSDTHPLELLLA